MEFVVIAVLALGSIAAMASPATMLLSRGRYPVAVLAGAKRMLYFGAFVAVVAICHVTGVSFAFHGANVIVEALAVLFGMALVVYAFLLRPRSLGVMAGVFALLAWLLMLLFLTLGALFDGGSPRAVRMQDGSVCQMSSYGFVASDSGVDIDLFRRFLFMDKRIAAHRYSDIYPDDDDLVYPDRAMLKQCLAAASAAPAPARSI